jgi:hypothetical protein
VAAVRSTGDVRGLSSAHAAHRLDGHAVAYAAGLGRLTLGRPSLSEQEARVVIA